jgi:hypothetical protein
MTKQIRRSAPEVIGTYLGWDIRDVSDMRYQSTRYSSPAVYGIDVGEFSFVCAPSGSQKLPNMAMEWGGTTKWTEIGEAYGRKIYGSTGGEE